MKTKILKILIVLIALIMVNCGAKKTIITEAAEIEKISEKQVEKTESEIVEVVRKETTVPGDTIRGSAKTEDIKKTGGVTFETESQKITAKYDAEKDEVIFEGIQKAKKQIEEVRREITQKTNKDKTIDIVSEINSSSKQKNTDTGRNGWTWFKIGIATAVALYLIWRFRKFIPYLNRL